MAAPLVALCKGCRDIRDQARLYMDRVNIWEMQGNARSVQDVQVGIPAVCVWLATDKLGKAEITRQEMQRASGLTPQKFDHAVTMIRNAIAFLDQGRERRPSRRASLSKAQEPPMDKSKLLDMAKKVQSGEFLPRVQREELPPPAPNPPCKRPATSAPPPSRPEKTAKTVSSPSKASTAPKVEANTTASTEPKPTALETPSLSSEDLYHKRLLSLGLPAYRQGIKFDVQPRRKRGRPPAPRLTPQELSDKQFLAALWAKHPPTQPKNRSMAGVPPRYTQAKLSAKELHWMRPIPMPLTITPQDPSGYGLPPSEIWRRWSASRCPRSS